MPKRPPRSEAELWQNRRILSSRLFYSSHGERGEHRECALGVLCDVIAVHAGFPAKSLDNNADIEQCLNKEFAYFPHVPIITLGNFILKAIVKINAQPKYRDIKTYWGYVKGWKKKHMNELNCSYILREDNYLQRAVFPFPHKTKYPLPEFYERYFTNYTSFIKKFMNQEKTM